MGLIVFLIVGGVAGWLAAKFMNKSQGMLMNILTGIVGAYIGGFLGGIIGYRLHRQHRGCHSGCRGFAVGDRASQASLMGQPSPASAAISLRDFRARSVADLSCPQAAMISSPRGVRIGEA